MRVADLIGWMRESVGENASDQQRDGSICHCMMASRWGNERKANTKNVIRGSDASAGRNLFRREGSDDDARQNSEIGSCCEKWR
jgi:hypothetical protein